MTLSPGCRYVLLVLVHKYGLVYLVSVMLVFWLEVDIFRLCAPTRPHRLPRWLYHNQQHFLLLMGLGCNGDV
jgi:hypothetical protein